MLRTIGHVLAKIDAKASDVNQVIIQEYWDAWKQNKHENWIFWEFIEDERNNILKAYKFGVDIDDEGLWHSQLEKDGIQLMREATYWWRSQLIAIEDKIARSP
ncbi:hypothetical protein DNX69_23080 [Rhodopseudomonas palustris]|uniref:Uncharacterized protein n=2 Tax=Rhodopseudomonas palustris TaxID=1076 RepID=A0A323UDY9_RHOPL|nr:hypothetical protein DNX69_23080 [Rhodopseudomonas palustris]